jgi:mannose-6-phosphate isomerase-like protein (cupin superfamily)
MSGTYQEQVIHAQDLLEQAKATYDRAEAGEFRNSGGENDRIFVRELSGRYSEINKKIFESDRVMTPDPDREYMSIDPGSVDHTQLFHCHFENLKPGASSVKHGHMNSAVFYILEGDGYDVHDGIKLPWHAGDICVVQPGCVHQHFNASPDSVAKMIVIKAKPVYLFANLGFQKFIAGGSKEPVPGQFDPDPAHISVTGGWRE